MEICRQAFDAQDITKKAVSHVQTIESTSGRAHSIRHHTDPHLAEPHQSDRLKVWPFYSAALQMCPGSLPGQALVCQPLGKIRKLKCAVVDHVSLPQDILPGDEISDDITAIN